MKTDNEPQKKRLIDHTRAVIQSFPPKYLFSAQNIMDRLDADGITYNKGALKNAVMATLIRQGDIVLDSTIEGQAAYRRFVEPKAPDKKPVPIKKKRRPTKLYLRVTATQIVLTLAERPSTIVEINAQIKHYFKEKNFHPTTAGMALRGYQKKGLVDATRNTLIKHHPMQYMPNDEFFKLAVKLEGKMIRFAPHLKGPISGALKAFGRRQKAITDGVKEQKQEAAQAAARLDQPVDWDLPENSIAAADLGAAFFEYMRRLNRQLKNRPKGCEAENLFAKLKYKVEELNAQIFTRTRQVNNLENENKRLKKRLEAALEENKNLLDENQNLKVTADKNHTRAPKTSFKMSEVASFKNLLDGKEEEVIDGTQALTFVG